VRPEQKGEMDMTSPSANVKLVSNAMANATRRKIMALLVEKERTREEVEKEVGAAMLDYHLQMLQQAGLAEIDDGGLSSYGLRKELHGDQICTKA